MHLISIYIFKDVKKIKSFKNIKLTTRYRDIDITLIQSQIITKTRTLESQRKKQNLIYKEKNKKKKVSFDVTPFQIRIFTYFKKQ